MPDFSTTDVAAHVGQNVPNPLTTLSGIVALRNAQNQLKLFPLQQQQLQTAVQTSQQALAKTQYDAANAALASLDPKQRAAQGPALIARLTQAGVLEPQFAASVLGGNVDGLAPSDWETLGNQGVMAAGNQTEVGANFGTPSTIQTGAGTKTINTRTGPGGTTVSDATGDAAMVPNALGPKDLSSPVETVDDSGTKTMAVMGDYINPDGSWKGGVPHPMTALGPLSQTTNAALGAAYGPQIAQFENTAPQIAAGRQAVENLRVEGDQFAAGPQSDLWKHLGELASEYGIHLTPPATRDETAAREAYAKNLTLVLSAQQKALHMDATDAARQTAELSVPSEMTTPEGRNRALAVIEGNLDAQNAMLQAWGHQKVKGGPASWGQFQMEFPHKVPPSIFQAQYMSAPEIAAMQKGWSAAKKADWQRRYDAAKKLGWLPNAE